ncbi:DSBA oxidoreductase, putative [Babesia ovis]|uniref:DSBA oxidoreductase, putative n=1 Tax=Babesia ovis TaxID=5869 RepID=A0A9W5T7S8_BABOV|nr:DSBA oxidoreductase, putative [Babesia ovis]
MTANTATSENYITQWYNGNYELMHSCLKQLSAAGKSRKSDADGTKAATPVGGFWSRFLRFSKSREDGAKDSGTKSTSNGMLPGSKDLGGTSFSDPRSRCHVASPSDHSEVLLSDETLEKIKSGVITGFKQFIFHRPHFVPSRKPSMGLDALRSYIRKKFSDLERSIDQIESFSTLANVDQHLCCELLYEGICYYGEDSQNMSEYTIIENMLHAQSEYQIKCLLLLFTFINNGKVFSEDKVPANSVFPEAVTILNELLSKGLVKNVCLLLMSSTKEACRYKTMLSGDMSSIMKVFYDHTIELINSLICLLETCFLYFHPTTGDVKCLLMLLPHVFDLANLYGISDYGGALAAVFDGLSDGSSAWYPSSKIMTSLCIGVREFDQITNNACNMGNRLSLIVILSLHPQLYRLSGMDNSVATLLTQTDVLDRFKGTKSPFSEYNKSFVFLEFFIFGVYCNDMERAIKCVDSGVFLHICTILVDTTPVKERPSVLKILELLLSKLLFSNNSLSKMWYDLLDYEVLCKRNAEDSARLPFWGTIDEKIYRPPGRSLIELLSLLARFETCNDKQYAFQIWKSCAETYRSVIPNVNCHVYNTKFDNKMYNCAETSTVDKKLAERLLVPCDGFSWWERNSALLDLVTLAAGDHQIYVETYPCFLTKVLEFGLYLSQMELDGESGGRIVGKFLNMSASRELRFPFILERLISQIGTLTKGAYDTLPGFIYERLLARDDQIETAEATLMIASTIQAQHSQQGLSVGNCLRKMYTFPLISGVPEVKIALSTLGLGGRCPFGLIETSIATFKLISHCDRIPRSLELVKGPEVNLDVNIQHKIGGGDQSFLNSVFSILSRSHMEGLEMLTSSVLSSLCSNHIKDSNTACAALLRLSELLSDSKGTPNRGFVNNGYALSVEELRAYVKCVRVLFLYVPREKRFRHSGTDWLQRLVEFATWILDTHCLRNECVHWDLIEDVFDFFHEVIQGPFGGKDNTSKASQYLLEQFLQPASNICVSLVRAAWESKILSAISIICILFKRDILLIVAHRAAMFMYTNREGSHCPYCNLPYTIDPELRHSSKDQMDFDEPSGPLNWWSNKIRKINSMFSIPSRDHTAPKTCECLQLEMHPISVLMAHDAVIEAMTTLRSKGDYTIDLSNHCDFIDCFGSSASEELRMKSVYLLLQLQERVGIESLIVSNKVLKELQSYYSLVYPCEEFSSYVMYPQMEAEDLVLYNKVASVVTTFNRMDTSEHHYYCMSHLCDLNRCGIDNLVLFLLNQCSKKVVSASDTNFGNHLLGSDTQIVALINLASGGGDTWQFCDWRRMDALAALISFSKISNRVLDLISKHWPTVEEDARKFDFMHGSCESYIMQCQRLSYLLQLLDLLATSSHRPICGDPSHFLKLYPRLVNSMCEMTQSMRDELDTLVQSSLNGKTSLDPKGFVNMWKYASFQSNVSLTFDLQLGTKLLNPLACDNIHKMNAYALRVNLSNMVLASSTALITSLLKFVSHCPVFDISGISEKSRSWLEFASAEFNPDETSELKLALQIALIKELGHVWIKSNVDLHGNNSVLSISIVLKLLSYILSNDTSPQLRSKIYACVNLFVTNPLKLSGPSISELVVAHLLSHSSELPAGASMNDRTTLLQLLWSDATTLLGHPAPVSIMDGPKLDMATTVRGDIDMLNGSRHDVDMHTVPVKPQEINCGARSNVGLNYSSSGRQVCVGQDYGSLEVQHLAHVDLQQIINLERVHSNEMLFIAIDSGIHIDYRVEALTLLHSVLSALQKFEAGAIEYDLGTVCYGSLGTVSTASVSLLLQERLLRFQRCKQCLLYSLCCPLCLELLTGTSRVLKAVSGLQQFSTFWFHIQPTSPDTCLVDQFLSCDLLLGFTDTENLPTELFYPFISILENLLCMPSVKSRNALIKWLNRHSELLGCCMVINRCGPFSDDSLSLVSSLLRIYRVCVLWLLAEYRRATFQSEHLTNFSLVLADLQCKFPLAMTMPRVVPSLLEVLTLDLSTSSDCYWQCILLGLQTMFPELGAFESDLDFTGQTPIKALAVEKASTVAKVLVRCGTSLISFINHLNMLDPAMRRKSLSRFALRIATVECAAMLLEYILALVVTHNGSSSAQVFIAAPSVNSNAIADESQTAVRPDAAQSVLVPKLRKLVDLSRVESLLDNISRLCGTNGARLNDSVSARRKHVFGDHLVEYLAPYDLEHVPSFGNVQQYSYSYTTLYGLLLCSICNLSVVLEQYYGCKFSSPLLSREQLQH